jgi:deoxycytidine triphosphate deaminase
VNQPGILLREDILEASRENRLVIDPFDESHLQPTSYDISVSQILEGRDTLRDFDQVTVERLQFMNFVSEERFEFPLDMIGHIYFRSTYSRQGLGTIHLGRIEAGWTGRLVIEVMSAKSQMTIKREERIATVEFVGLSRPATSPYKGQFQGFGVEG